MAERLQPSERRMTETVARGILQAVVSTYESSIKNLDTSLEISVGHSLPQIRRAVDTVGRKMLRGRERVERRDPNVAGTLSFWIEEETSRRAGMELAGEGLLVSVSFPLEESDAPIEASGFHFIDTTSGISRTLNNRGQPLTAYAVRQLFKGTRWLAVNMLDSRRIIFPDQLDYLSGEYRRAKRLLPKP